MKREREREREGGGGRSEIWDSACVIAVALTTCHPESGGKAKQTTPQTDEAVSLVHSFKSRHSRETDPSVGSGQTSALRTSTFDFLFVRRIQGIWLLSSVVQVRFSPSRNVSRV